MTPYREYDYPNQKYHESLVELTANERTKGGVGPSFEKRKKLRAKRKSKNRS